MIAPMPEAGKPSGPMRRLLWAGVLEMMCFIAGVIAWWLTGSWAWIVIGVVAGAGFSLPAIITYIRENRPGSGGGPR
jgi:hypothetical protein